VSFAVVTLSVASQQVFIVVDAIIIIIIIIIYFVKTQSGNFSIYLRMTDRPHLPIML
jgi:hypothetical protein